MPAMVMRFWPEWSWIKQAIDAQTYGKVLAARFRRVEPAPGLEQGQLFQRRRIRRRAARPPHPRHRFVQFCFGRPRSVFSVGATRFSGAIDHVVTSYNVAAGIPVTAEGSWLMAEGFGLQMECTVNFEKATVDYDLARGTDALKLFEEGQPPRTINASRGWLSG